MTTATEYRQYAQECIQGARDATSEPVRKQFLDLAQLWMTAAAHMEARATPSWDNLNGQYVAGNGGLRISND